MAPLPFFLLIVCMLALLLVIDSVFRRRRARQIVAIGAGLGMNYSPLDRFALTERLMGAPEWSLRASDLSVKDVLYASQQGMRCFIATVKCRRTIDQDSLRFVVQFIEHSDSRLDLTSEPSATVWTDPPLYRRFLEEWCANAGLT